MTRQPLADDVMAGARRMCARVAYVVREGSALVAFLWRKAFDR